MMMPDAPGGEWESLRRRPIQRLLQQAVSALWLGVIPGLLTLLAIRLLVPPAGSGLTGVVGWVAHRFGLLLAVALFFFFSGLARYWRFRIPGGRYASALPAHLVPDERDGERLAAWASDVALYEAAIRPAMRRTFQRTLEPAAIGDLARWLLDLRKGLETGDAPMARAAAAAIRSTARTALAIRQRRDALATLGAAALAAVAAYGVRTTVVQSYEVLSASMLPTLEPGDRLLGSKLAYVAARDRLPRRGDVVTFQSSEVALPAGIEAPEVLVKRVLGLPGDRIAVKGGQPVINGWPVPYCDAGEYVFLQSGAHGGAVHGRLRVEFIDDRAYLTVNAQSVPFRETYEVKPGEVFVLGDNRGNSLDSRAWNAGRGGGVPVGAVDARARWFLMGTHRSGDPDFGRLGHAIDRLEGRVHLEGVNAQSLDDAVARCLASPPSDTHPPDGGEGAGVRASREPE
jgi:signal peptidase I